MSHLMFFAIIALAGVALFAMGKAALEGVVKVVVMLIAVILVLMGGYGVFTALI